jgi:hypothetical protein
MHPAHPVGSGSPAFLDDYHVPSECIIVAHLRMSSDGRSDAKGGRAVSHDNPYRPHYSFNGSYPGDRSTQPLSDGTLCRVGAGSSNKIRTTHPDDRPTFISSPAAISRARLHRTAQPRFSHAAAAPDRADYL